MTGKHFEMSEECKVAWESGVADIRCEGPCDHALYTAGGLWEHLQYKDICYQHYEGVYGSTMDADPRGFIESLQPLTCATKQEQSPMKDLWLRLTSDGSALPDIHSYVNLRTTLADGWMAGPGSAYFGVYSGASALILASLACRPDVVSALLERGVDVKERAQPLNVTALHAAAANGDVRSIVLLATAGAPLDSADSFGCTPLHYAARFGQTEAICALARRGADVDALDSGGNSPLHAAAGTREAGTVRLLLLHGAKAGVLNATGLTDLHIVAKNLNADATEALAAASASHFTVNDDLFERLPPLHLAATLGDLAMVKVLLRAGADVNVRDALGQTALHLAAWCQCLEVVKYLVDFGAEVHAVDDEDMTAGYMALTKEGFRHNAMLLRHEGDFTFNDERNRRDLKTFGCFIL
eukprot:GILI01006723.1.p1 GENE.GILI01006723.1~~GILI01006723.1.p1  ORF type:complete len:477 (-),score=67.18 GILI01006723.1:88-1323(-)